MKKLKHISVSLKMQNEKYGFVDGNGHLVIECIYDEVFEENLLSDNPNDRYFVEDIPRV